MSNYKHTCNGERCLVFCEACRDLRWKQAARKELEYQKYKKERKPKEKDIPISFKLDDWEWNNDS
jgi:hypothetical protein